MDWMSFAFGVSVGCLTSLLSAVGVAIRWGAQRQRERERGPGTLAWWMANMGEPSTTDNGGGMVPPSAN